MVFQAWKTWVAGQPIPAADLNQDLRDNGNALFPQGMAGLAWSPAIEATVTNPTNVGVSGIQYKRGAMQWVAARFVFTGNEGSGEYFVTLPEAAVGITATLTSGVPIGQWNCSDVATPANSEAGTVMLATSTTVRFRRFTTGQRLAHNNPFTFAADDVISFSAEYPYA